MLDKLENNFDVQNASRLLAGAFWIGLVISVIGAVIYGSNQPGVEVGFDGPVQTGNAGAATFGLFLLGAGVLSMQVALVGWGVKLGVLAAARTITRPLTLVESAKAAPKPETPTANEEPGAHQSDQ